MIHSPARRRALLLSFAAPFALPLAGCAIATATADGAALGAVADKPLVRDPVFDGAADPVLVWNPMRARWWMFYTNRRATAQGLPGVSWVHGTRIGIAESSDGGAHWTYVGTADVDLPPALGGEQATHWAPDIVRGDDGTWHMFLTVVPGVFEDWKHPRHIVRLTSRDLRTWGGGDVLRLANDKVIDPSLARLPDGSWRLWYNNEADGKTTYFADSPDLVHWVDRGPAVHDRGEGPKVFYWRGAWWLIIDPWRGLAAFRSDDALTWTRQAAPLLDQPGNGPDDGAIGGHADVVVSGGRAWLFYFVHPGRGGLAAKADGPAQRRSVIQVVELREQGGVLSANRDEPTHILLGPPTKLR
jgi:hypothetical protein